ncbi:MAG TPA: metallophosphoesterase family protein [Spirochaetia bacterium]|nr:metallophosphoesterase family protein [Spirochaetia bacterium]
MKDLRAAFLSDIHANFTALAHALESVRRYRADAIFIAGDLVGGGPHPVEVLRYIEARNIQAVRGNVENRLLGLYERGRSFKKLFRKKKTGTHWTGLQLGAREWSFLSSLPESLILNLNGFALSIVHGSPLSDAACIYPSLTAGGLRDMLVNRFPDVLVCGHTHIPFTKIIEATQIVNCGSVGLPVNGDPRGSYALVDLEKGGRARCRIVRFAYPTENVLDDLYERKVPRTSRERFMAGLM